MDGVSAAASIGQLVGFGGKVTMTLIRLIRDISRGPVTYKNEETNVRHLLLLVRRIATEKDCHTHDFLELFARVDATAQKILQLLQGATSSLLFRVVSAITKHRALAEAFGELYATRELLHFHISCTLSQDVRACLEAGTGQACKDLEMDSVESPMSPVRQPWVHLQNFRMHKLKCWAGYWTGRLPGSGVLESHTWAKPPATSTTIRDRWQQDRVQCAD